MLEKRAIGFRLGRRGLLVPYAIVVNGPTRSGPNPARTRKCKPEPENNLKL